VNTTVRNEAGTDLGYYFWCSLSKAYIAVRTTGGRASARSMTQAERFIRGL
jgi:hypothetical protein